MLGFAKMLWQTKAPDASERMQCDLFVLEGTQWISLTDGKCTVSFESDKKSGASLKFSCPDESFNESMRIDSISNLSRFDDADTGSPCFQWIVRKGKNSDNMEEFGARFSDQKEADKFVRKLTTMGQQSADVIFESSVETRISLIEKLQVGEWDVIDEKVSVLISQAQNGDRYLTVQRPRSEDLLFHSLISPALQLGLSDTLITFLGYTPLSEDIRVLALRFDKNNDDLKSLTKLLRDLGLLTTKQPRAPPTVSAWEEEDAELPTVAKPRRGARKSDEIVNLHLQTGHTDDSRAIVFASKKSAFGYDVFDTSSRSLKNPKPISTFTQILPPSKKLCSVMIHEADRKVLMLGSNSVVSQLDLERGKVVNEWNSDQVKKINSILPKSRLAQSSSEQTFLGMNEKSIFVMDPRAKDSIVTSGPAYTYSSNVKLSAAATDDAGHIVIANKLGQFRLFDGQYNRDNQLKRAKSLLAGVGDPILHVNVSSDGKWILGTSATYLVLINVCDANDTTGFEKSVAKTADPVVLALDADDVAKHRLTSIAFTAAKFDEKETKIITSTGSLAIVWDFDLIKSSHKISYSIKPMKDYIIETGLVGSTKSSSVVAMYSDKIEVAHVRK